MSLSLNRSAPFLEKDFIPISRFELASKMTVAGGAAGTALGITADADAFGLTKAGAGTKVSYVPVQLVSAGNAAATPPPLLEVGAIDPSGVFGLKMTAEVAAGSGEGAFLFMEIPRHWTRFQPIDVSVVWTSEATAIADRAIVWSLKLVSLKPNTAAAGSQLSSSLPGGLSSGDFTTTFASQAPTGVTSTVQETAAKRMPPGTLVDAATFMQVNVAMTSFVATFSEAKYLLGLAFEYTPRYSRGLRRKARLWSTP